MRRLGVGVVIAWMLFNLGCSQSDTGSKPVAGRSPVGQSILSHDLGTILGNEETSVSHDFDLACLNGEMDLAHCATQPSCSCTTAHLVESEGGSFSLTMVVSLRDRNGPQLFNCRLVDERGHGTECLLQVRVLPQLECVPHHVIFRDVRPGGWAVQKLQLTQRAKDREDFSEIVPRSRNQSIAAETMAGPPSLVGDWWERTAVLSVSLTAGDEAGRYSDYIELESARGNAGRAASVPVHWRVSPPEVALSSDHARMHYQEVVESPGRVPIVVVRPPELTN